MNKAKHNVIPRKAKKLDITYLIETSSKCSHMVAEKDDYSSNWIGTDDNGKRWSLFPSMLRNSDICNIVVLE